MSSHGEGVAFSLGVGEVIEGWDRGVAGMKVGGKRKLTLPQELGYGAAGSAPPWAGTAGLRPAPPGPSWLDWRT